MVVIIAIARNLCHDQGQNGCIGILAPNMELNNRLRRIKIHSVPEATERKMDDQRVAEIVEIAKRCRRPIKKGSISVCIDDRLAHKFTKPIPTEQLQEVFVTSESESGPQIPGASAGVLVAVAECAPDEKSLDFDELNTITREAHVRAGFALGVHMDNHHDEVSDDKIFEMVERALEDPDNTDLPGCGYAGMLVNPENPLNLSARTHKFVRSLKLVPRMLAAGSRLVELEGHHAEPDNGALAIINNQEGTTLDHDALKAAGVKVYGFDPRAVEKIMNEAVEVLEARGETDWAENVRNKGAQVVTQHQRIAAVALTGREPVEIA